MKSFMKFLSALTIGVMAVNSVAYAVDLNSIPADKLLENAHEALRITRQREDYNEDYDADGDGKITSTDAALFYKKHLEADGSGSGSGSGSTDPNPGEEVVSMEKYGIQGFAKAGFETAFPDLDWKKDVDFGEEVIVKNEQQFLDAIYDARNNGDKEGTIIKVEADVLNLGNKDLEKVNCTPKGGYTAYTAEANKPYNTPLLHPKLIESGVGQIDIRGKNIIIYSDNGAEIKHGCFVIKGAQNVAIRNLSFKELWEWDEATFGHYDRNGWDYFSIENTGETLSQNIWIDHCTFTKSYDGIIDSKRGASGVSMTWCKVDPRGDKDFIEAQLDELEKGLDVKDEETEKQIINKTKRTVLDVPSTDGDTAQTITYKYPLYQLLRRGIDDGQGKIEGYEKEEILAMIMAQQKSHLVGSGGDPETDENILQSKLEITLANNYYHNVRDRIPRIRGGNAHIYNCVIDSDLKNESSKLGDLFINKSSLKGVTYAVEKSKNENFDLSNTSQAFKSTEGAALCVENTIVNGVREVARDQEDDGEGMQGKFKAVNVKVDGTVVNDITIENKYNNPRKDWSWNETDNYSEELVKSYIPEDLDTLEATLEKYAGAGNLTLTDEEWTQLTYKDDEE